MDTAPDNQEQLFAVRSSLHPAQARTPAQARPNTEVVGQRSLQSLQMVGQKRPSKPVTMCGCCLAGRACVQAGICPHASARHPHAVQLTLTCADHQPVTPPGGDAHSRAAGDVPRPGHLRQAHRQHRPQHLGAGRRQARHPLPAVWRHLQGAWPCTASHAASHVPAHNAGFQLPSR